jgi:hypothetical protein
MPGRAPGVIEALRLLGLVALRAAVPLLLIGQSAGDCVVVALVGVGLSRVGAP